MNVLKEYYKTKEHPIWLFCLLISIAVILTYAMPYIQDKFISTLVASFSIFTALLFNLLLLLIDMIKSVKSDDAIESRKRNQKIKLSLLEKCMKIISASILFSIIEIVLLLLLSYDYSKFVIIKKLTIICTIAEYFLLFLTYLFILLFINSLYSILEKMHLLISKEIYNKNEEFKDIAL